MGATFNIIPAGPVTINLPVYSRSDWKELMEKVFHLFPITLCEEDVIKLEVMKAANWGEADAYNEIIEAISKYKKIIINVSY